MVAKLGMHSGQDTTTSQYTAFGNWVGTPCLTRNVFGAYDTWAHIASPFMLSTTKTWLQQGSQYQEVISIGLCPDSGSAPSSSKPTLSQVASGTYDTYFTQLGQNINSTLGALHSQVVIRLGWEGNGDWYQWGYGTANAGFNSPTDFKNAYAHVVPLIKANAPNLKFEWCLDTSRSISGGLIAAYPGDSVVDFIGADVYNHNNTGWLSILNGGNGQWTGGLSALRTFAQSHGKHEAYTEWSNYHNANGVAGDDPFFIQMMYLWFNTGTVDHQCYWNSTSGGPNCPLNSTELPIFTGSISGTTLTVTSFTQGSGHIGTGHSIFSADPQHHTPVIPGTIITANGTGTGGTGTYTINKSQTVESQTMNDIPVVQSAQVFQTLFSKNPVVVKIPVSTVGGVLVPSQTIPPNYICVCDGANYNVAKI